uniref:Coiled-coil domain containing 127b n=1 Tax=Cyprinus carpio TaxID=7962 RepID=A0A8C1MD13_CYPCA
MNDLNDPQGWNIRPERQDGGDSSKWNYALLVPMLGPAAFRMYYTTLFLFFPFSCALLGWIWSKQFQKKITEALASQNQKFKEERCRIRMETENKISRSFQEVLEKEKKMEYRLMKRQEMFCSNLVHYSWNVKMEDELLNFAAKHPLLAQLKVVDGLRDIFKNDRSCAEYLNTDPRRNGCLMWLYLRYWQLQVTLQTHQRAEVKCKKKKKKKGNKKTVGDT